MLKELFFTIITFFNPSFGVQQIHVQPIENTSSTSDKQTVGTLDDAIAQANEALKDKDVEIYLEGNIKLTKPIKIENKTNHKLTIKNGTIDGSKQLTNQWTNTGNDIYTYTFPANEKPVSIPILYIDNQEQKPASKDLCTYDKVIPMKDAIIESVTGSLASSANEIHSMWVTQQWSFTESRYTIGKINNNKIYLSEDAKKALVGYKYPTYHLQNKNNTKYLWYTAYNSSAFIQNDKDFSYNRDTGVLTLKSAKNPSSRKIEIPATDSLIEVVNANNVHFDNVTFTKTANTNDVYNCFRSGQGDAGVNQVQAKVNRPSIININEANNITFDKCKFEKLNNTVVAMDNRVFNSTITNSTFTDIGGSAVRIGPEVKGDQLSRDNNPLAYLDKTATEIPQGVWQYPQNITIDQNSFNNIGTNYKGSIGVFVEYGNNVKVDHNTFDKTSYSAISVGWGWHNRNSTQAITNKNGNIQVTNNFITNAMTETVDGAPIYHLGYAGEKDIISGNYINTNNAENGFNGGIYLDEGTDNVDVQGNVVIDCMNWIDMRYMTGYSKIQNVTVQGNYTNTHIEGSGRIAITDGTDFKDNIKVDSIEDSRVQKIKNNAGCKGTSKNKDIEDKTNNEGKKDKKEEKKDKIDKIDKIDKTDKQDKKEDKIDKIDKTDKQDKKEDKIDKIDKTDKQDKKEDKTDKKEENKPEEPNKSENLTKPEITPTQPNSYKVTINNNHTSTNWHTGVFQKGKRMVVIVDNVEDDYIYEGMTVVENGKTRKIDGDTYTIQSLSSNVTITTNVKKKEKPKPQQQQITGYGVIVNNLSGTTCNYQTRNLPRGKKVVIIYAGKGITGIEVKENGKIKKIDGNTYTIQSLEGVVEVTPIIK